MLKYIEVKQGRWTQMHVEIESRLGKNSDNRYWLIRYKTGVERKSSRWEEQDTGGLWKKGPMEKGSAGLLTEEEGSALLVESDMTSADPGLWGVRWCVCQPRDRRVSSQPRDSRGVCRDPWCPNWTRVCQDSQDMSLGHWAVLGQVR